MVGRVDFISGRGLKNKGIVGVGMVDSNSDCLHVIAPARKSGIARAGVETIAKITTITISRKFFMSITTGFRLHL